MANKFPISQKAFKAYVASARSIPNGYCPLEAALKKTTGTKYNVSPDYASWRDQISYVRNEIDLPLWARNFVASYDSDSKGSKIAVAKRYA